MSNTESNIESGVPPTFSRREMLILTALCDTLVPTLDVTPDPAGLFARKASDIGVPEQAAASISAITTPLAFRATRLALHLLDTPLVNAVFGGPNESFLAMNLDQRTTLLRSWAESDLFVRRTVFAAFKRVTLAFFYSLVDAQGDNPSWPAIGYPGPLPAVLPAEKPIKPLALSGDTTLYTDVVVVGSGAGGGVVAGELSAAGLDVIVLEKGGYYAEQDFDGHELPSVQRLFENLGLLSTSDQGMVVLAGSTLGGGTTVNWCASFRTRPDVLDEWAHEYGLKAFAEPAFQQALDRVSRRINVNERESDANPQNAALERGGQALGYTGGTIPRNVNGCQDCGFCGYGCRYAAKQGTLRTYLQDAFDRGARIVVRADAERILIENGAAVGVVAQVELPHGGSAQLMIRARAVVAAAGSLNTPALLMRTGLANPHIGRHLHLHPTTVGYGMYESPVEGWKGVMMSRYVSQFNNLDGHGYGVMLETAPLHPGVAAMVLPWSSGEQHKRLMSRIAHLVNIIVITRDHHGGRVTLDRRGKPILHYTLTGHDGAHMMRGILEALRIHRAAGALEINGPHTKPRPFVPAPGDDAAFEAYLRSVDGAGLKVNDFALLSAHQMSSCRMAANPTLGALDPNGETFEVRNLFVADASALPTATGTNPMLTIMGAAYM